MTTYPKIAEYGTLVVNEHRAIWTKIAERSGEYGRRYQLAHSTAGYEPAGAAARWTDGYWVARIVDSSGTTHGRQFGLDSDGESQARALYSSYGAGCFNGLER